MVSGDYSLVMVRGGLLIVVASLVAHRLSYSSARGISQIRNRTAVPRIARWILNHWTTSEALYHSISIFHIPNCFY